MILIINFFHKSFLFQWRYSCMRINSNSFSLHSFSGRYITGCRSPLINGSAIARLYSILIGHSESISLKIFSATPSPSEVPFIRYPFTLFHSLILWTTAMIIPIIHIVRITAITIFLWISSDLAYKFIRNEYKYGSHITFWWLGNSIGNSILTVQNM